MIFLFLKIYQNRFSAGFYGFARTCWVAYSTLSESDYLVGLGEAIIKEERGREGTEWRKKEEREDGREVEV